MRCGSRVVQATVCKTVYVGANPTRISNLMKAQDYIISTLKKLKEPLQVDQPSQESLEDAIYTKVMSKKFRKLKPGEEAVKLTKQAIKIFVEENKPVRIFELFGGNKLWRFEEAPEVDWAELFSLTYFVHWCRLIASIYKPGVIFEYFSQDVSVKSLNNLPRSKTDKYSETFRSLIKFVEPYLPPNVKITYTRHYELFKNPNEYYTELEEAKKIVLKRNGGKLPQLTDAMKAATELNVKLKPGQADDPQWREKVELEHQAIFETKTLKKISDDPAKIWTCPTYYPDSVVTGSTKRSYAKFWAAVGVLKPEGDSFAQLVLTPNQLETAKFSWEDMNIKGLQGKNFKKIRILKS